MFKTFFRYVGAWVLRNLGCLLVFLKRFICKTLGLGKILRSLGYSWCADC